ncbi:MAG: ComEA family DNA-binding protein [Planctomycetota bacterium]
MANKKLGKNRFSAGSALILTVVLTTLLAAVGVVFVMMARVDKISTSAISENRELDFAVEAVIAKISQELVLDLPRGSAPCCPGQEYYDYPDPCNAWLASLEPDVERDPNDPTGQSDIYYWRQISDVTGDLARRFFATRYVKVDPPGNRKTMLEYPKIYLDINGELDPLPLDDGMLDVEPRGQLADADGDHIADSKWILLYDITTSKGKPIYAAIRIVDNQAMLNANTAFKFDPNDPHLQNTIGGKIDGSSQMQINLHGLARPAIPPILEDDANEIHFGNPTHLGRCGISGDPNWDAFRDNMIRRIESPAGDYLPFDISDELELRYRFCITSRAQTRLESLWNWTIGWDALIPKDEPYGGGFGRLEDWQNGVTNPFDPNNYRRHLLTTYNIDRIIDPNGDKMININNETTPVGILYRRLLRSIDPNLFGPIRRETEMRFAQLAVNIIDFADSDDINNDGFLDPTCVTTLVDPCGVVYYGFEAQPFITEIGMKSRPGSIYCAVELYNPFDEAIDLIDFEIELTYDAPDSNDTVLTVAFDSGDRIDANSYFVVANDLSEFNIFRGRRVRVRQDPRLRFFGGWRPPNVRRPPTVGRPRRQPPTITARPGGDGNLFLRRRVASTGEWLYVDRQVVDPSWVPRDNERYYGRDVRGWHVIYQTLAKDVFNSFGSLGIRNPVDPNVFAGHHFSFFLPNPLRPGLFRPHEEFITVGDVVSRILTIGHGTEPGSSIGQKLWDIGLLWETDKRKEYRVRLNLQDPNHRNIFQYLTVFDPSTDNIDNDGDGSTDEYMEPPVKGDEIKIPGRININTAPWYVIAQLPWVRPEIAQAIVAYRDKLRLPVDYRISPTIVPDPNSRFLATGIPFLREDPGFESIGELNFVVAPGTIDGSNAYRIQRFEPDGNDLGSEFIIHPGFPDLTTDGPGQGDGVVDDFEERDVIFSRISNLVTVRSDVFTAYILVRIGTDGPQKRAIAILDRSDVYSGGDKVRLVALHYVPDPR